MGLGTGMRHRLYHPRVPRPGDEAEVIDLQVWAAATALRFCGIELRVNRGLVRLLLTLRCADGTEEELARLEATEGLSSFSPPLEVHALAARGGEIRISGVELSADAQCDLYLGTNDAGITQSPCLVVLQRVENPAEAATALERFGGFRTRFAPLGIDAQCHLVLHGPPGMALPATLSPDPALSSASEGTVVHLLTGPAQTWFAASLDMVLFGALSDRPYTHVAAWNSGQQPEDDAFMQALGLARFLRSDSVLHSGAESPAHWPPFCTDLRQVCRHAEEGEGLGDLIARLAAQDLRFFAFAPAPPPVPPFPRPARGLVARLGLRRPPSTGLRQMKLALLESERRRMTAQADTAQWLEARLRDSGLGDPARAAADADRANRAMLSLLRNRHRGERAVIVGNGPSLCAQDLDRLGNTVSLASNKIYLIYSETGWRPTYYSVEDHLVLRNAMDAIRALQGSIKIFPANTRNFGYHAADTIFAPFLPPRSFSDPLSDPDFPAFSRDLSHGIAWGSTVVYSQIQMAAFMGCTEIVLIGIDHHYVLPATKVGNRYIHEGEQNHFHPDYRAPDEAWHQPNLEVLEKSYSRARQVCEAAGIRIVNASRQTALEVFERADFDILFPPGKA